MTVYNSKNITENRKKYQIVYDCNFYGKPGKIWIDESDDLKEAEKIARKNRDGKDFPIIYEKNDVDFAIDKFENHFYIVPKENAPYYYYDTDYKEWEKAEF